ncbi:PREDICTED: aspartyl protease APCB1 isoform X2 [Nelumbo nucifera]|uniref:Aspartyl protease APCB1 isoform X2 n=1 Tax=Nelumbo nucifera TaxID=4432 RepID=A0A1U8AQG5_NELNU|nr:PREDICTED: aspartyl protease APCB1 isoform X2 [Nelumbo nucifera]
MDRNSQRGMESLQLQGVVIITLPPEDNPSKGKTITAAFALSGPPSSQIQQQARQQPHPQPEEDSLPIRSSPNSERYFSFRGVLSGKPKQILRFLAVSVLLLFLWSYASPETLLELRDHDEDRETNSFVFTLHPKPGTLEMFHRDVELKLGRFVEANSDAVLVMFNGGVKDEEYRISLSASSSSAVDKSTVFPVRGNIYPDGLYYASIYVGSPPKPYYLDMDTGSDLTWIQCDAPCISCAKGPHPLYKPSKGKIVPPRDSLCLEVQTSGSCETCQQCDYEIEYADRSSSMGVLAMDDLPLMIANGTEVTSNFVFGCAYDQQGQLSVSPANTDGILGLSRAKISLPSQLASQGIIRNVVGHCIRSDKDGGGYMFLGDDFIPWWGMTWVPMLSSPSMNNFYHTEIMQMTYGGGKLSLGGVDNNVGRVVFDSGSSYTYFTREAYLGLIASLENVPSEELTRDKSDSTLPICWRAKSPIRSVKDVKPFFKPLTLHFGNRWWILSTKMLIPPEGYLIINKKGNVCLGILDGSKVHDGSTIILGDISLRGQLVVYDNVNERIGWVRSDCIKPQKLESFPFL